MTFSMVWIWAVGDATVATPGFPVNCSVMIEAWEATVRLHRHDEGTSDTLRAFDRSGGSSCLASAKSHFWLRAVHDFTNGSCLSSEPMALYCEVGAPALTNTTTPTPCCHRVVAFEAPCFNSSAEPTRASDT